MYFTFCYFLFILFSIKSVSGACDCHRNLYTYALIDPLAYSVR